MRRRAEIESVRAHSASTGSSSTRSSSTHSASPRSLCILTPALYPHARSVSSRSLCILTLAPHPHARSASSRSLCIHPLDLHPPARSASTRSLCILTLALHPHARSASSRSLCILTLALYPHSRSVSPRSASIRSPSYKQCLLPARLPKVYTRWCDRRLVAESEEKRAPKIKAISKGHGIIKSENANKHSGKDRASQTESIFITNIFTARARNVVHNVGCLPTSLSEPNTLQPRK